MAYIATQWYDRIKDPVTGEIIQDGTPVNQVNMNKMEKGIADAHLGLDEVRLELARLAVYAEIDGRATGHAGTFFDTLDGTEPHLMVLETATAVLTEQIAVGTLVLPVDKTEGFAIGKEITIADDGATEDVMITEVGTGTITVDKLLNGYKKGAVAVRSTMVLDATAKKLRNGAYTTYDVSFQEL